MSLISMEYLFISRKEPLPVEYDILVGYKSSRITEKKQTDLLNLNPNKNYLFLKTNNYFNICRWDMPHLSVIAFNLCSLLYLKFISFDNTENKGVSNTATRSMW